MNLIKSRDFFDPSTIQEEVILIGCGAIGSTLAELLTRVGVEKVSLYDFDTVTDYNLANQMFLQKHIGEPKVIATADIIQSINPDVHVRLQPKGYQEGMNLSGYVFLCVDDIDIRRNIVKEHYNNPNIKVMFDFRMGMLEAQAFAADWKNDKHKANLLAGMAFTQEEAQEATPVTACGVALSVAPTVRSIVSLGVANFIQVCKGEPLKQLIISNPFTGYTTTV